MDYRDEVFIAAAEQLSFSKAAEVMYISQPAVTKHIQELESRLKTQLFQRKGSKIYLTKAGKLTYRHLKDIKQQYRSLEFELGRLNDDFTGLIRIGASSTLSQYVIPSVIAAFHRRYPNIKVDLYNGNSFEMEQKLLNNDIDIALVENESSQANLRYVDFWQDKIVAVCSSQSVYGKRSHLNLSDLQEIPMVLREKGSGTLECIQKELSKQKLSLDKLNILIHLGSTESIKNFLCDFDGITLISDKSIAKELLLKTHVILNVKDLNIIRKFRVVLNQGTTLSTSQLFVDYINAYNF